MNRRINDKPEPVSTLIDLTATHSLISLLEGIAAIAEFDSENNSCCLECGRKAQWLYEGLCRLLDGYENEFPISRAIAIPHPGPKLVRCVRPDPGRPPVIAS